MPKTYNDIGWFLEDYCDWLRPFISLEKPDLVVFEAPVLPRQTTISTARKLMCLAGVTELVCRDFTSLPVFEEHLQSVKKFFTGSGRASKEDMIATARKYGWDPRSDDEADALGLWCLAVHKKDPAGIRDRKLQVEFGGVR